MVIYKTTNLVNNKIYIGQDTKNNPNYFGSGKIIKKAIIKYGKENFKKEVIEECFTINELNEREKYWIEKLNSTNPKIGYNVSFGGQTGWMSGLSHSELTKKKFSEKRKGKLMGEKNPFFGKKHKEESKLLMIKPHIGENNGMYGKKHTDETKNKMSEKLSGTNNPFYGKSHSEETKKLLSEKLKNRGSVNGKKIKINQNVFNSLIEASNILKTSRYLLNKKCYTKEFDCTFII